MFRFSTRALAMAPAIVGFFVFAPAVLAQDYSDTEVLVQFVEGRSPTTSVQRLHNIARAEQVTPDAAQAPEELPEAVTNVFEVEPAAGETVEELVDSLSADPRVVTAELNPLYELTALPNDSLFSSMWGLNNTGQSGGTDDADIDAVEAWDTATTASDVVVAVIDTGIDYTHPDLASNMWVNPGEIAGDGIDNDGNGYIDDVYGYDFYNGDNDPYDDQSHGTHVAGTIGAVGNNSAGVVGVTWDVQLAALKVCGTTYCSGAAILEAVNYAASMGMPLSNNSYGGGGYSSLVQAAINEAGADANHLYIAAAGNASNDNDANPFYPASYESDYIVSVASTTRNDNLSSFSNYGATSVDIAAPGSSILSTTPDGLYGYKSGTSMATPHVVGAAALALGVNSSLSPLEVRNALINSGDELASLSGKTAKNSRLNVATALRAAVNNPPNASLTADTTSPTTEDTVTFDASGSSDPDGDMLMFQWNFGNGSSAGPSSTPTASFRFSLAGTFTVSVTVSDEFAEDTATMTVQVSQGGDSITDAPESDEEPGGSTENPEVVVIDSLVWERKPSGTGWRVRWQATEDTTRVAQLIRKTPSRRVVLKKWNRKGKNALPASKVRTFLKNHPNQFRNPAQLRVRLVVRSKQDPSLWARKSSRLPKRLYRRWKAQYGN